MRVDMFLSGPCVDGCIFGGSHLGWGETHLFGGPADERYDGPLLDWEKAPGKLLGTEGSDQAGRGDV